MKHTQDGFSIVEVLMLLLVVGVLAAAGAVFYARSHDSAANQTAVTSSGASSEEGKSPEPTRKFINVIRPDNTVVQMTPEQIAKTPDQIAILKQLHSLCSNKDPYITVPSTAFDGGPQANFQQDGGYAMLNAVMCDEKVDHPSGGGANHYVRKAPSGAWTLNFATQMVPDCEKVDGLGYPVSILPLCSDGDAQRAPR